MMVEKELGRARRHGIVRSAELYQTGLFIWGGLSRQDTSTAPGSVEDLVASDYRALDD